MNCYSCFHCQKDGQRYICSFKAVMMGNLPYYPTEIPKDAFYFKGMEVCNYQDKTVAKREIKKTLDFFMTKKL